MKKGTLIIVIVCVLVALAVLWTVNKYNALVVAQESVTSEWANVESQYQRRADLIPNLVSTVKGYAEHESSTLESVMEARAKATGITVDPQNLTPEALAQYQQAQGEVGAALGRLMMISENYPNLKANENFMALQEQLEGTENRIQVSRSRFNETARVYNTTVRRFPNNIIASLFGFDSKAYFEAEPSASTAPKVEF